MDAFVVVSLTPIHVVRIDEGREYMSRGWGADMNPVSNKD